jgi:hypothetical protein
VMVPTYVVVGRAPERRPLAKFPVTKPFWAAAKEKKSSPSSVEYRLS